MHLVVIGLGYVGLPLAVAAAEAGVRVTGIDIDDKRVGALNAGRSYIEDIDGARLRALVDGGSLTAATSYAGTVPFDVAVITVPTPLGTNRSPNLTYVESSARDLAPHIRPGTLVVLESTTYPGTTEELLVPLLETGSGLTAGVDFLVGYSPERIDPGSVDWKLENTPKVVAGVNEASREAVASFYARFVSQVVPVSSCRAAELTKLLENTFRHVNIALVNELAIFAKELRIDVREVVAAAATKPFGFMRFNPGPGVGGHCLPIDPAYLSWRVMEATGRSFRFVELANDINEHMPDYVVQRLTLGLNDLGKPVRGSTVLLLGLAYKKNTADVRESPAVRVAELLRRLGANLVAYDPHAGDARVDGVVVHTSLAAEMVRTADAVVLLTDHDDCDYDLVGANAQWLLDCRGRLAGKNVEAL